jgi:hypothetical protein
MTRINTDEAAAQGLAWTSQAARRFQIPSQASLHGILKTHRSSAPRLPLLLYPLPVTRHTPQPPEVPLLDSSAREG